MMIDGAICIADRDGSALLGFCLGWSHLIARQKRGRLAAVLVLDGDAVVENAYTEKFKTASALTGMCA